MPREPHGALIIEFFAVDVINRADSCTSSSHGAHSSSAHDVSSRCIGSDSNASREKKQIQKRWVFGHSINLPEPVVRVAVLSVSRDHAGRV